MTKLTLYQADCLEAMKQLQEGSIDAIITDPPYALTSTTKARIDQSGDKEVPFSRQQSRAGGFMGMAWDSEIPKVEIWQECLRLLKDGAFAFIFMTPRQDSHLELLLNLRQAGFNIGFTPIVWAYASGFPKASNISKMVDKRLGVERESLGNVKGMGKQNPQFNGTENGRSENFLKPEYELFKATSEQAKALDGSYGGFQPKPAVEMIVVAMKPLKEKTYIDQALSNRHGCTWLDDCRVPTTPADIIQDRTMIQSADGKEAGWGMKPQGKIQVLDLTKGRFPANLLVSDNVLDTGREYTPSFRAGDRGIRNNALPGGVRIGDGNINQGYDDSGDFSRYFNLDAWAEQNLTQFIIEPKADKGEKNENLYGFKETDVERDWGTGSDKAFQPRSEREMTKARNIHPSVKPIDIMAYLIKLSTREGDTVLDPFLGSGTTMIAARNLRRNCIGMEREEQYLKIAKGRLQWNAMQKMGAIECEMRTV